jgi:hypothetical protein
VIARNFKTYSLVNEPNVNTILEIFSNWWAGKSPAQFECIYICNFLQSARELLWAGRNIARTD